MSKQPCVYMLASKRNGTIYTGVTSNLIKRIFEHKSNSVEGFTKKYRVHILVWFELFEDMESAILKEKKIKAGSRAKKIALIESSNSKWQDLSDEII